MVAHTSLKKAIKKYFRLSPGLHEIKTALKAKAASISYNATFFSHFSLSLLSD
jgi:hypothetical protein